MISTTTIPVVTYWSFFSLFSSPHSLSSFCSGGGSYTVYIQKETHLWGQNWTLNNEKNRMDYHNNCSMTMITCVERKYNPDPDQAQIGSLLVEYQCRPHFHVPSSSLVNFSMIFFLNGSTQLLSSATALFHRFLKIWSSHVDCLLICSSSYQASTLNEFKFEQIKINMVSTQCNQPHCEISYYMW